jgi:glucosamine kinase
MILIADAGGTKTDWRAVSPDGVLEFQTVGYSLTTHDAAAFFEAIRPVFSAIAGQVERIHFYGAGFVEGSSGAFEQGLGTVFKKAKISSYHDVLGACRALAGNGPAFVGILGTGSMGCYYNGERVAEQVPSLGYVLGDEGSGAWLGRLAVVKGIRKGFPEHLQREFDARYGLKEANLIQKVYKTPGANTWLATFSRFLFEYRHDACVAVMLMDSFDAYFKAFFADLTDRNRYPLHLAGSIAFHYDDLLRELAPLHGFTLDRVVESPIRGLTDYHQQNG